MKWPRLDTKFPEKTINELYSVLSEEQKKAQSRKELDGKNTDRKTELDRKKSDHADCEKRLNDLFSQVGVSTDEDFLALTETNKCITH